MKLKKSQLLTEEEYIKAQTDYGDGSFTAGIGAEIIREMLINLCKEKNFKPIFPPKELCGDNAAMIAMVGLEKYKLNQFTKLDHPAIPRWPLDENAAFLKGAGVKF